MSKIFYCFFILVSILEVLSDGLPNNLLHACTKPLLMPLLIAFYIFSVKEIKAYTLVDKLMVVAFFFSWIGDIALMFGNVHQLYFLAGLAAFLITHVFYILAFNKAALPKPGFLKLRPFYALPVIVYCVFLATFLMPAIPAQMQAAIVIYAIVIGLMVLTALNNAGRVPAKSFLLVFSGAVLFMFSDSLIAVNKFAMAGQLPYAGVCIMFLYIAAQLLVAKGMLIKNQPNDL
jgi:uncharacterized membrane protein YhhN